MFQITWVHGIPVLCFGIVAGVSPNSFRRHRKYDKRKTLLGRYTYNSQSTELRLIVTCLICFHKPVTSEPPGARLPNSLADSWKCNITFVNVHLILVITSLLDYYDKLYSYWVQLERQTKILTQNQFYES